MLRNRCGHNVFARSPSTLAEQRSKRKLLLPIINKNAHLLFFFVLGPAKEAT